MFKIHLRVFTRLQLSIIIFSTYKLASIDSMEDLPLKCYACNNCEKFMPTPTHISICLNCYHSKGFHDLYEEVSVLFIAISYLIIFEYLY